MLILSKSILGLLAVAVASTNAMALNEDPQGPNLAIRDPQGQRGSKSATPKNNNANQRKAGGSTPTVTGVSDRQRNGPPIAKAFPSVKPGGFPGIGGFPGGFPGFPKSSGVKNPFVKPTNVPKAAPSSTPSSTGCPAVWTSVSSYLTSQFVGSDGQCNDFARGAIRAAFHDCGSWNQALGTSAGCDGSLYLAREYTRSENAGLENIVPQLGAIAERFGVGMADFFQFAGTHATVSCPLGPRVKTLVGRTDRTTANPEGLLPDPHTSADTLFNNMASKGFSAVDIAAILGAHTSAKQFEFDPSQSGAALDDTPGVWDVRFYGEVLDKTAPFILPSDAVLANDTRINPTWKSFVQNQAGWDTAFSTALQKMMVFGVANVGSLVDCTSALPGAQPNFKLATRDVNKMRRRAFFGGGEGGKFHGANFHASGAAAGFHSKYKFHA